MTRHTRRPRAEYEALLTRRREEHLTFAELSAESGVPTCTLQYWARKLKDSALAEADTGEEGAFLQVGLAPLSDAAIELVLPGDIRIAVRPGFDAGTLRAVAAAFTC